MADGVPITAGSGTTIATDDTGATGHVQLVKLAYSADGVDTHVQADANGLLINTGTHQDEVINSIATTDVGLTTKSTIFGYSTSGNSFAPVNVTSSGALTVAGIIYLDQTRISVTPTVSTTPAYTAKDAVGGKLTFSNAARTSGGSITIQTAVVIDNSQQMPSLELVLFDRDFTASTDNAAFDPTDADLANIVGVVKIGDWSDFNDNAVAMRTGIGLSAKLNGTALYGQLVTRTTPTFVATNDITVILEIIRD